MAEVITEGAPLVDVEALKEHPRNPRIGDVAAIASSIEHNGFFAPILYQKTTSHVLAGNHRLKAALRIGMKKVPAIALDVDDEHALRVLLADNRMSDLGSYDEAALVDLLKEIGDSVAVGYSKEEVDRVMNATTRHVEFDVNTKEMPLTYRVLVEGLTEKSQNALIGELESRGLKCKAMMF
jgi:ParB/RepB/Spo0J family partition protein